MTKFKSDDFLGKVVKNTRMFCSIGVEPIKDMFQLRFAAGGNKFSQLCGFIFDSANESIDYPRFSISFVCKLRSKIYRQQNKNPSMWYIFKKISNERVDVLDEKQLLVNYGFDIKKFFQSDMFKAALPAFEKTLKKGISECETFAKTLDGVEIKEATKFINAIKESLSLLKTARTNDKYYKLNDLDAIDAEVAKLNNKSDDEKKKELDAKTAAIHQDAVKRMSSAAKYSDKAAKNDYVYQRLHGEKEESDEKLNEAAFNFDKYDWKDGSITGKGLIALISDTDKYSYNNAIKIYDRKTEKFYDIVDDTIDYKNKGLILDIDTNRESSGKQSLNKNESDNGSNDNEWKPVGKNGNKLEINDVDPFPEHMIAAVERIGNPKSGKWQVYIDKQPLLTTPVSTCSEANTILTQWTNKFWKETNESNMKNNKNDDKKEEVSEKETEEIKFESMLNANIDKALEEIYK